MAKPVDFDPFKDDPIDVAIKREGVTDATEAAYIRSIYQQESGGGKNTTTSNQGARGPMQVIDSTFKSVADPDWDKNDKLNNTQAGVRYAREQFKNAGGNVAHAAAGYYGGPGGLKAAQRGEARFDSKNPNAPNTLQYGQQVAERAGKMGKVVDFDPFAEEPKAAPVESAPTAQNPPPAPATPQKKAPSESWSAILKRGGQNFLRDAADLPANFVVGAGKTMSYPMQGVLGKDWGKGTRESLEQFRRENTNRPDTIGAKITEAIPEVILTKDVGGKGFLANAAGNVAIEGSKAAADDKSVVGAVKDALVGSAIGHGVVKAAGGLRTGLSKTMQELTDRGYVPTIGQMGGKIGRAYDHVTSVIPGMAGATERSARNAESTISRARANEALEAVGGWTDKVGNEAVDDMGKQIKAAYGKVTPDLEANTSVGRLSHFVSDHEIKTKVPLLDNRGRDQVRREVEAITKPYMSSGKTITGDDFKKMEGDLNALIRDYTKDNSTAAERRMAEGVRVYKDNLRTTLYAKPGAPGDTLPGLKAADTAYRASLPVEDAATRARAAGGRFSAAQDAAATDRFNQPRNEGTNALIEGAQPRASGRGGAETVANRWGPAVAVSTGALSAPTIFNNIAAGDPLTIAGAAAGGTLLGAHQLVNTETGRKVLLNGLAGVIPKSALGRISGLPPREAQIALRKWLAKPGVARAAARLGSQVAQESPEGEESPRVRIDLSGMAQ